MNPEDINKILREFETLKQTIDDIKTKVRGISIDEQLHLKANTPIAPGMACKVAYDMHGLVLRGEKLLVTDIPELSIDHITGLRNMIAEKATKKDIEKLQGTIESTMPKKGKAVGSGTKVNYDANGLVVSVADLLADDIPLLPMEKIEGLAEIINFLKSQHSAEVISDSHSTVMASTYTKVTCDEHGHIIKGERLTSDDIPSEIIVKMNTIESRMTSLASQQTVDNLTKMMAVKLDANAPVVPGTYCKVRFDSKGLVTGGEKLTKNDLPQLAVRDIDGLQDTLLNKADREAFMNLSETVSRISEAVSKLGELSGVRNTLQTLASQQSVKDLDTRVKSLREIVDKIVAAIPADTIAEQLSEISGQISTMNGRITTLEKKIGIPADG